MNLAKNHARLELPSGKDTTTDVRFVDLHELSKAVAPCRTGFFGRAGLRCRRRGGQKMCILWKCHGLGRQGSCWGL
jgi:hypothetical protein